MVKHDAVAAPPGSCDAEELAGFDAGLRVVIDRNGRAGSPPGNAYYQPESGGLRRVYPERDGLAEGIHGALLDGHAVGGDCARTIGDGGETAIGGGHPQAGGKLRPSLVQVGGTAAVVRFEPEDVGLGAIGGPAVVRERAHDLVGLLVVLMRPEVFGERGGQGIVGDFFEAVAERRIAEDGQVLLEREHGFDDGAEFGALTGVAAGEMFVGAEDAIGLAVVAVERVEHAGWRNRPGRR
jgi:hypothetical protein